MHMSEVQVRLPGAHGGAVGQEFSVAALGVKEAARRESVGLRLPCHPCQLPCQPFATAPLTPWEWPAATRSRLAETNAALSNHRHPGVHQQAAPIPRADHYVSSDAAAMHASRGRISSSCGSCSHNCFCWHGSVISIQHNC